MTRWPIDGMDRRELLLSRYFVPEQVDCLA